MEDFFRNRQDWLSLLVKNINKSDEYLFSDEFIWMVESIWLFRGNVIATAISIENRLNFWIEYLIFNVNDDVSITFQKIFLQNNYLTFYNKRKIFKELCKLKNWIKTIYDKKVISEIQKVIEYRNNIAHWGAYYDHAEKKYYFTRIKDNELKIEEINNQILKEKLKECYECISKLTSLYLDSNIGTKREMIKEETKFRITNKWINKTTSRKKINL